MPRLLMLGVTHHAAPVEVRERVAIDEKAWRAHAPAHLPTILVSTCNRLEVYAWIEGRTHSASRSMLRALSRATGVDTRELEPYLIRRVGSDAVLHLVRVASGLDSAVVGEEQIRGQVRDALRAAEASEHISGPLRGIFQRAIESARRIRGSTRIGQIPSIAAAGVNVATRLVPDLLVQPVAVLGAGVMARAATESLLARGATVRVLNRTPAHAERVFGHLPVEIDTLDALPKVLRECALVVCATAARTPVVGVADVEAATAARAHKRLVLLDIALPRDVDPRVGDIPNVKVIDLDDLERMCPIDSPTRAAEQQRAETLAVQEAERVARWLGFRAISPAIAELRNYAEGIRTAELRRSAARLRDLTPEQVAAVEALTSGIVNKLMHGPTVALRQAGRGRSRSRILRLVRPTSSRQSGRTA
jgi:glutamyl-tRNA reductase